MIGQQNLIRKIDNITQLPHSIILYGERGSEQQDITDYIAEKFKLQKMELDSVYKSLLDEITSSVIFSLYVIDLTNLSLNDQYTLLKTLEEPSEYSYFVLLSETNNILDTLKTRSFELQCDLYTEDQLRGLVYNNDADLVLSVCKTPGQVEIANHTNMAVLKDQCELLIRTYKDMSQSDALLFSNKINFSDNYSKLDLYLFIKMMKKLATNPAMYARISNLDTYIWGMNDKMNGKQRFFDGFMLEWCN